MVEITMEEDPANNSCFVSFNDNGCGIEDFQILLTLGQSGWDSTTQAVEDPAGMGLFSLCHSEIEVHSGNYRVVIGPQVFLGSQKAEVNYTADYVSGTRIKFSRASTKEGLKTALCRVSEFCPLEVWCDGQVLPRHDFLEGALHREVIDGIEVGFGKCFAHATSFSEYRKSWNFHGALIDERFDSFTGLIDPARPTGDPQTLFIRFSVLETGRVKLQLPDRRAIIQDDQLRDFYRKVRAAVYRFFQSQSHHALAYAHWAEARDLGIVLPEAICLLSDWHATPTDDNIDPMFGYSQRRLLNDLSNAMLVDRNLSNQHTLEGALNSGATLAGTLWAEDSRMAGYSWYEKLPRIVDCEVFLDGTPAKHKAQGRPSQIELRITVEELERPHREVDLPALIHVDSEEYNGPNFVAVRESPWDNDSLAGPFDVIDFLVWATFLSSDDLVEADSWYTQRQEYEDGVRREVNEYFRGPRASLMALLNDALSWDIRHLAQQLGATEILFKKTAENGNWEIEIRPVNQVIELRHASLTTE